MPNNLGRNKTVLIILTSSTIGVVIIGALAMYFRRRKKKRENSFEVSKKTITDERVTNKVVPRQEGRRIIRRTYSINSNYFSPKKDSESNGGIHTMSRFKTPSESKSLPVHHPYSETSSDDDVINDDFHSSISETECHEETSQSDSNSLATTIIPTNHLKPSQLLESGMDLLLKAQSRWRMALDKLDESGGDGAHDEELFKLRANLSQLLELADAMRGSCSQQLLTQLCAGAVVDAALVEMDREYEATKMKYLSDDNSDLESFYSTLESIDLSDIEEHKEIHQHLHLYEEALNQLEGGAIPYRCLRTKQLDCSSDTEYLAKLYCVRKAFDMAFAEEENRLFFEELGRNLVGCLLSHADKDSKEFEGLFDELMTYLKVTHNWVAIEEELKLRNVRVMSFFDIVIEFLLFDSFDDLDLAPPSIIAIINNNWITNGFKETAILTFVWSVLKAKKAMLKQPNGFMSRFYSISEITSPVLAWGFLGPSGPFKQMCEYFKDQIMDYVKEIFNFTHVRYTCPRDLSDDVMRLARSRGQRAKERLSVHPSLWQ